MKTTISTTLLIFFCLLFLTEHTSAQTTTLNWVISGGANGEDRIFDSKIDAQGNIYSVGVFNSTVDFDPGTGVYNLSSNGSGDAFVSKHNANGNLIWAKSFGSSFGKDIARKIAIDDSGNVYVSGLFYNSVDFDPDTGSYILQSNGMEDAFLLKLDSSANFQWAISFGGNGFDYSIEAKYHPQGLVLLSGTYTDSVDFDPDTNVLKKYGSNSENIFLSAFDPNGSLLWTNTFPTSNFSTKNARGYEIAIKKMATLFLQVTFLVQLILMQVTMYLTISQMEQVIVLLLNTTFKVVMFGLLLLGEMMMIILLQLMLIIIKIFSLQDSINQPLTSTLIIMYF